MTKEKAIEVLKRCAEVCPTSPLAEACWCAQYRDGWNDAMQYIFRDGKGYRPYRRDEKYEG